MATGTKTTTLSALQIALDLGASLAHAVVAGVVIGLASAAVVALLGTTGA